MNLSSALKSLCPTAQWSCNGEDYGSIIWHVEPDAVPTQAEIDAEIARLQAEYESTAYQRQRAPQYPELKDFVDAYYWAQKGDNTKMDAYIAACDKVKADYPKPA